RLTPAMIGVNVRTMGTKRARISDFGPCFSKNMLPELASGMVPKMEGCLYAVRHGVTTARVLDGRVPHSILLEIFTDEGIGTMVLPDGTAIGTEDTADQDSDGDKGEDQ
ncbi:hypothetical protein ACWEWX_33465, partial [Streptomyces asiaticus]